MNKRISTGFLVAGPDCFLIKSPWLCKLPLGKEEEKNNRGERCQRQWVSVLCRAEKAVNAELLVLSLGLANRIYAGQGQFGYG